MAGQELALQKLGFQESLSSDQEIPIPEQTARQEMLGMVAKAYGVADELSLQKIAICLANAKNFKEVAEKYGFSYHLPPHRMGYSIVNSVTWVQALEIVGGWFLSESTSRESHTVGTEIFRAMTIEVGSADWNEWTTYVRERHKRYL